MIDTVFAILFLVTVLGLCGGLVVLFVRTRGEPVPRRRSLDGGWPASALAAVALAVLVGATAGYLAEKAAAPPTLVVRLTGFQFGWRFDYFEVGPDGEDLNLGVSSTGLFVLPRGVDVEIRATSSDVIHRLEIPELGVKRDLVPELVTRFRVRAERPGTFIVLSDSLCGAPRGVMAAPLKVVDSPTFRAWIQEF